MAEPIELPFGVWTQTGARNDDVAGLLVRVPPTGEGTLLAKHTWAC